MNNNNLGSSGWQSGLGLFLFVTHLFGAAARTRVWGRSKAYKAGKSFY